MPAAAQTHVSGKGQEQRTEECSGQLQFAQVEKAREGQSHNQALSQMLIDKSMSDEVSRQPGNGVQEKKSHKVKNIPAHADRERPGGKTFLANMIGEIYELGIGEI